MDGGSGESKNMYLYSNNIIYTNTKSSFTINNNNTNKKKETSKALRNIYFSQHTTTEATKINRTKSKIYDEKITHKF